MRLSPSRLSKYLKCPKAYEFKYVLGHEEESGQAAVNGKFVHRVLEETFKCPPGSRTLWTALSLAQDAWDNLPGDDPIEPELDRCQQLIWNLFDLEDPTTVNCRRTEMDLELPWGDHTLKGIIDRVDVEDDGYVIVDYKTGKAPADKYLSEKALGIKMYALLGQMAFGSAPVRVKLLYLGTPQVITFDVTPQMLRGVEKKALAGVAGMEKGDYRAKTSFACNWCSFQKDCTEGKKIKPLKKKSVDNENEGS